MGTLLAIQLEDLEKSQGTKTKLTGLPLFLWRCSTWGPWRRSFFFTWKALFLALFLCWVSGSLGIGMAYHRLLTHRGFKTPKWVEYFLTVCATLRRRRPDFLGGNAPNSPSVFRSGRRSALANRRQVVGAHGMDPDGQVDASRRYHPGSICPRPGERQISRMDHQIPLCSADRARILRSSPSAEFRGCCGESSSASCLACTDMAREFGDSFVGNAPVSDS